MSPTALVIEPNITIAVGGTCNHRTTAVIRGGIGSCIYYAGSTIHARYGDGYSKTNTTPDNYLGFSLGRCQRTDQKHEG
jgi:hypothetical protein